MRLCPTTVKYSNLDLDIRQCSSEQRHYAVASLLHALAKTCYRTESQSARIYIGPCSASQGKLDKTQFGQGETFTHVTQGFSVALHSQQEWYKKPRTSTSPANVLLQPIARPLEELGDTSVLESQLQCCKEAGCKLPRSDIHVALESTVYFLCTGR